jgi:hypothetical protein
MFIIRNSLGMNAGATTLFDLERYSAAFSSPLSADQVRALAALFGWIPPDGLEEAPALPC